MIFFFKKIFTFLLVFNFSVQLDLPNYTELIHEYCGDDIHNDLTKNGRDFERLRSKIKNPYSNNWNKVLTFFYTNNTNYLFGSFLTIAILMFIFVSVYLISNMVFCFIFCRQGESGFRQKFFARIAFGLGIACAFVGLILFILMCVNDQNYRKVYCNYYFTIGAIQEGSKNNIKYIGISNLQKMFENFSLDVDNMKSEQKTFKQIAQQQVYLPTNQLVYQFDQFQRNNGQKKTLDPQGEQGIPITGLDQYDPVDIGLMSNFTSLNQVGISVQRMADLGASDVSYVSLKPGADGYQQLMQLISFTYQFFIYEMTKIVRNQLNTSRFTIVVSTCLAILIIAMLFYQLYYLRKMAFQDKHQRKIFVMRLLLVFFSLFCSVYSILTFVIIVTNIINASFCGFIAELNRGRTEVFNDLEYPLDPIIQNIWEIAFNRFSDGDMSKVIFTNLTATQRGEYPKIMNFINGVTEYQIYSQQNYTSASDFDLLMQKQTELQEIQAGQLPNHVKTNQQILKFNELISCSGQNFTLAEQCEGCYNFQTTENYSIPDCVQNRDVPNQMYQHIKASVKDTDDLIDEMLNELINNTNSTQTLLSSAISSLNEIQTDFQTVKQTLNNTNVIIDEFKVPLNEQQDMRVVQLTAKQMEVEFCFNQQVMVTVICFTAFILAFLLLIFCWTLYFAYINKNKDLSKVVTESSNMESQKLQQSKKIMDESMVTVQDIADDNEMPPNY